MAAALYEWMTPLQAEAALEQFRTEHGPALHHLRAFLVHHGQDPEVLLDGSPGSVAPLWEWLNDWFARFGVAPQTLEEDPARESWPSWAHHGRLVDPHPPAASLALLDGFTTYLGQVIGAAVPEVHWRVGEHRIADHPLLHYPVLAAGDHQLFLRPSRSTASISPSTAAIRSAGRRCSRTCAGRSLLCAVRTRLPMRRRSRW